VGSGADSAGVVDSVVAVRFAILGIIDRAVPSWRLEVLERSVPVVDDLCREVAVPVDYPIDLILLSKVQFLVDAVWNRHDAVASNSRSSFVPITREGPR